MLMSEPIQSIFKNKDGGTLLLAYLKANRQQERDRAHNLLVQLDGADFGFDELKWSNWIKSL